jgi:hypothetical protein
VTDKGSVNLAAGFDRHWGAPSSDAGNSHGFRHGALALITRCKLLPSNAAGDVHEIEHANVKYRDGPRAVNNNLYRYDLDLDES